MNRAKPTDLRKSMEAATALMKAGIDFVPIPVLSLEDQQSLTGQMIERLEQLEAQAETDEQEA